MPCLVGATSFALIMYGAVFTFSTLFYFHCGLFCKEKILKNLLIISLLLSALFVSGCGFLTPVQKKDSSGNVVTDVSGNPVIVAAGSVYLEKAQGVLQVASAFPMFGGIASGIAGLLGVGVLVSNRVASSRKTALTATVAGVGSFSENFDKVKSSIMETVSGFKNQELTTKVDGLLSSISVKNTVSTIAGKLGVWKYLDAFVQKIDPKVG